MIKLNSKIIFLLLCLITCLITIISNTVLNTDELLISSLSEKMTQDQIKEAFEFNKKWQWSSYLFIPIFLFIKIGLISSVLYMGLFFFNKQTTFKRTFTIVTKGEFIFIGVGIIKLIWFSSLEVYTLEDIQHFYPLSALSIVGHEGLSPWFLYPFQTLNLFELVYWIVLAYLISKEIKTSTDKALKIVASSYGSALLIWVVAIMFINLNAS
ncbi:hypothetical protein [Aquimarina sp. AU474]|uniref:hypothetical protein n=1 Tax=Aquimarina sp. AU474 TaxID=2108529 RepID=UPI0013575B12|nr:hypothetical protein [Aquimarina sp. AU474]